MTLDRAEAAGLGLSVAAHAALIAILALGLFAVARPPLAPPPAVEVDIVSDDVGLTSTTPDPATAAPAPRIAPDVGPPEEAAPEPSPAPAPRPTPPAATAVPKPAPAARSAPAAVARPAPAVRPTPATRPTPQADARPRRRPGLDRSLVAGLSDSPGAPTTRPAPGPASPAPRAAIGPAQLASLGAAIRRQVQPCADRIVSPGPGAERITTKLNLQMLPNGRFAVAPRIVSQSTDGDTARYATRVGELARAAFVQCQPFELPAELYEGWKNINLNYKLPG